MTIQRKCMRTALVALSVMGSGSAFAVNYFQSFESLTNGIINTRYGWASGPNDLSVITNLDISTKIPACGAPIAGTHTNVLKLSTEDTILTNILDNGSSQPFDISSDITYVESMVQFVPREDRPSNLSTTGGSDNDAGIKTAIYLDSTSSNLMIYCGTLSTGGGFVSNAITRQDVQISLTNWYRLTVEFSPRLVGDQLDGQFLRFRINGVLVTDSNGFAYADLPDPNGSLPTPTVGTWFPSACWNVSVGAFTLSALCFQGTGYIDDLVVTTTAPVYGQSEPTPIVLTIIFGSNGHASTGGVNFDSSPWPVSVLSGGNTSVVYTAMEWYRIQALTNDATLVTAATDAKCYTQHFNNVTVPATNYVTFYAPPATNFNVSYTNVTTAWLASWGHPDNTSPYDNQPLTLQQQYLLDVDPFGAVTNDFRVTSIAVTQNTNVAVTVGLWINSINHTNINGKLILEAKDYLTNLTWSTFGTAELSGPVFTNGVVTYNFVDTMSNRFYRASITP